VRKGGYEEGRGETRDNSQESLVREKDEEEKGGMKREGREKRERRTRRK
jgi:hypothetical protein